MALFPLSLSLFLFFLSRPPLTNRPNQIGLCNRYCSTPKRTGGDRGRWINHMYNTSMSLFSFSFSNNSEVAYQSWFDTFTHRALWTEGLKMCIFISHMYVNELFPVAPTGPHSNVYDEKHYQWFWWHQSAKKKIRRMRNSFDNSFQSIHQKKANERNVRQNSKVSGNVLYSIVTENDEDNLWGFCFSFISMLVWLFSLDMFFHSHAEQTSHRRN